MLDTLWKQLVDKVPAIVVGLIAFTSISAVMIAGHVWRIPTPVRVTLDAHFYFGIFAAFASYVVVAGLISRVVAALLNVFVVEPLKPYLPEKVQSSVWFISIGLAILVGVFSFSFTYLGLNLGNRDVAVVAGLIALLLFVFFLKTFARVQKMRHEKGAGGTSLQDLFSLWSVTVFSTIVLIIVFQIGEFRMSHLMQTNKAQLVTLKEEHNSTEQSQQPLLSREVVTIIGSTSQGLLTADYTGDTLANKKQIVARLRPYSSFEYVEASQETQNFFISIVRYMFDTFTGVVVPPKTERGAPGS